MTIPQFDIPGWEAIQARIADIMASSVIVQLVGAMIAIFVAERIAYAVMGLFVHTLHQATNQPGAADSHTEGSEGVE